jgi:hypothetical protein
MDHLSWEFLSEEKVRQDEYVDLRAGKYRLPNGRILNPFYRYHSRSFVVIAAKGTEGDYLCVRQFRPGIAAVTTEFPAGAIEEGEDPLAAAKRELLEETGCVSRAWTFLGRLSPNATIADNTAWCYLAEGCVKVADQQLDASECLDVIRLAAERLHSMIGGRDFVQAVHVAAYYLAEEWMQKREQEACPDSE